MVRTNNRTLAWGKRGGGQALRQQASHPSRHSLALGMLVGGLVDLDLTYAA